MKRLILILILAAAVLVVRYRKSTPKPPTLSIDGSADMSITENLQTFRHHPGSPPNTFDLDQKRIRASNDMVFDGKQISEPATDTDLPRPDLGEYDRMTLTPGQGNLGTLREDEAFYSKALQKLVTTSSEYEIQLAAGTWDDYRSGRDVRFIASPRGIDQIKTHLADQTRAMFAELSKSAVGKELESKGIKDFTFTGDVHDARISNDPITANPKLLQIHDTGLTRVTFKFHGQGTKLAQ